MSEQNKIWLVSHGEYSDYSVVCAFSTEEKAKAFAKVMNGQEEVGDYMVEELELDEVLEYPPGMSPFTVHYFEKNISGIPDWRAFVIRRAKDEQDVVRKPEEYLKGMYGVTAVFYCLARNKEHAIKIGQERLQKHTAQAAVDRGEI